jgi:hypothetical protein
MPVGVTPFAGTPHPVPVMMTLADDYKKWK